MLSSWLLQIDGLAPNQKAIPKCILASSLPSQTAFLRGLFEDGTVNVADGRLDHVAWSTVYPRMAKMVQLMLLRQGIIASILPVNVVDCNTQWRVSIYGYNAHKFRDTIGFVSSYKNDLLSYPTGHEEGYIIPTSKSRLPTADKNDDDQNRRWATQNGRNRGYVSRHGARLIGGFENELEYHHERIVRIEEFDGPAVCVEVPSVGRFLQDGFDGSNSKGLEFPYVFLAGVNKLVLPHVRGNFEEERRLMYVAVTRAKDRLVVGCAPDKSGVFSPFISNIRAPRLTLADYEDSLMEEDPL